MTCEYLVKEIVMSRVHEMPPVNPSDAQLKHLCNKITGSGYFIEDAEYGVLCTTHQKVRYRNF